MSTNNVTTLNRAVWNNSNEKLSIGHKLDSKPLNSVNYHAGYTAKPINAHSSDQILIV